MASSFGGINTALTSLYAQRRGLDVTGQNIANVNTEGYTRQRVVMQAQVGSTERVLLHGDFRNGNLIVGPEILVLFDYYLSATGEESRSS